MAMIALEEHRLPADLAAEVGCRARMTGAPGIGRALDDLAEDRPAVRDAAGVDVQALSLVGRNRVSDSPPE